MAWFSLEDRGMEGQRGVCVCVRVGECPVVTTKVHYSCELPTYLPTPQKKNKPIPRPTLTPPPPRRADTSISPFPFPLPSIQHIRCVCTWQKKRSRLTSHVRTMNATTTGSGQCPRPEIKRSLFPQRQRGIILFACTSTKKGYTSEPDVGRKTTDWIVFVFGVKLCFSTEKKRGVRIYGARGDWLIGQLMMMEVAV